MGKTTKAMMITLAILLMFGFGNIVNAKASGAVTIIVNGQIINFPDAPAYVDTNGRTQVPSRFIGEALGLEVIWHHETKSVSFLLENDMGPISVVFHVGSAEYTVYASDGTPQSRTMDTKAKLERDRVYIPVRYLAEAFGALVEWDNVTQTATITLMKVDLRGKDLTSEQLAKMVASGEIPANVTHLDLALNSISDISPLSSLAKLTELNLFGNKVDNVSPLSNLTNLRVLNLWGNQISEVSPLGKLTNLTVFSLGDAPQFSGDISTLNQFSNLTSLSLGGGRISDFTPLGNLVKLEHLQLWGVAQLKDLSLIGRLTNLTSLTIHDAGIRDFTTLSNLTKLSELDLQSMPIRDVSSLPLNSLTNLKCLRLRNCQLSDIKALVGLTKLTELALGNNKISDISTLSGLKRLETLLLENNQIKDISALNGLDKLTSLFLNDNQIRDIRALSGLASHAQLVLDNNEISDWSPVAHITYVSGRP